MYRYLIKVANESSVRPGSTTGEKVKAGLLGTGVMTGVSTGLAIPAAAGLAAGEMLTPDLHLTPRQLADMRKHMVPGQKAVYMRDSPAMSAVYLPKHRDPANPGFISRQVQRAAKAFPAFGKSLKDFEGGKEQALRMRGQGPVLDHMKRGGGQSAVFAPGKGGAHVAAHELGHAQFSRGRVGSAMMRAYQLGGPSRAGLVGVGMATLAKDPDGAVASAAPVVAAAGSAPTLIHEFEASRRGLKGMKELGYSPRALSHGRRQLAKAFGTYGGMAAGAVAAPAAVLAYRRRKARQREEG